MGMHIKNPKPVCGLYLLETETFTVTQLHFVIVGRSIVSSNKQIPYEPKKIPGK